ncbi:NDL1 (YLR254C) [Zygosaccharomyces parabailii]|uniref:ZYBA0S06-00782g1_1 n=1 Tax=Zygosaccharomyces bailii (strain CLIB 213 / ATCC 58445 / CBS 680 / BCRC 21525 / NBRC 1098 / NCYC 1416 / NRRL Y-2227) TaxID=1333698 RepID=A0A8J2X8S7_ZYGB2|nr:NDL1 (YLR254C) [Zygosaccharomyces parabailii]CDF90110.1 ZYBA0S06-00782g1_1 [Zygosaccharomyces bailii CLIB 213]CDH16668.1 related to Nuclear distribution protein nudE homolog 1 [Zygosaccharomyces bailii ISA1307]
MDLPTALNVISTLESQLKELETLSKEYEFEMEQVIVKLREDYTEKCNEFVAQKSYVTKLEIQVDELESRNAYLTNRIQTLQLENDQHLERNVLLEHELCDAKEKLKDNHHLDRKKLKRSNEFLQVSTTESGLLVKSLSHLANNSDTKLSTSKVISTTFPGNHQ